MKHPPAGRVWMPTELLAIWSAIAPNGTTIKTYTVRHVLHRGPLRLWWRTGKLLCHVEIPATPSTAHRRSWATGRL